MDLLNELLLFDTEATWMQYASCRGAKPEEFFPEQGRADVVLKAKQVCFKCPVRERCLQYAVNNGIHYGVWGGLTHLERKKLQGGSMSRKLGLNGFSI